MKYKLTGNMCQYSVWPNCNNNCKFCLRTERKFYTIDELFLSLELISKNIDYIDWKDKFSAGISLLGGELYNITDKKLQDAFLKLIDKIVEKILLVSPNTMCKYSTVTNGIYNIEFLDKVLTKISDACGMDKVDLNFSIDLKYRYKNDIDKKTVIDNINFIHDKYNYRVGIQMILTLYLILMWKNGEFDVNTFINTNLPNNMLCFLYPHKVQTGLVLDDFYPNRKDFIDFIAYLHQTNLDVYQAFVLSVRHSSIFKYTGLLNRFTDDVSQLPILTSDKTSMNINCKHSMLYQCYNDTDNCMLCDLETLDYDNFLE